MTYGGPICHVTDDVTSPSKVKVVTRICLGRIISKIIGDRDRKVKVVTQIYLTLNMSKTVTDRGLVPMEHQ